MRIVVTADLSFRPERADRLAALAERIRQHNPDILLLAGDIGEPLGNFAAGLSVFADIPARKALVLGNKDVWNRGGDYTSQDLWSKHLPRAARDQGFLWLEEENLVLRSVGICGTIGWYDYSARDPRLHFSEQQYRKAKGIVSLDARFVDWPWTDPEFAEIMRDGFVERLGALEARRDVKRIIVITHMPVFQEALTYQGDPHASIRAAYAFNLSLGREIMSTDKVTHVVSGHSSFGGRWQISFRDKKLETVVINTEDDIPEVLMIET